MWQEIAKVVTCMTVAVEIKFAHLLILNTVYVSHIELFVRRHRAK